MKVRYCETKRQEMMPCDFGWGNLDESGISSCTDEPMEKNCHNIVEDILINCPYCKQKLPVIV